ncbi:MAG: efflux RND transporter periplasmic adaptor subunit [Nitrospirota bacterium]|nr:efflux RND transporter periplasmic adaptor subunit [Nitrospirota bacterium]MDH5769284.1 efflux RND transporter periplasmic adaptor subunit [Nitrospirota bacterium]
MADEDLSKLKIDKSATVTRPFKRKRRFYLIAVLLIIGVVVILYAQGILTPAVQVEVTSVTQVYPSQAFTLLNASGYVVAQRKAAVASKLTGRLVSLAVEEGSRVKEGQIIARLESDDAVAAKDQASANLNVARFNLDQARAELYDATLTRNRNKDLLSKGYIAQSEYDASDARYKKAAAAVAAAEAAIKASAAALQAADVSLEYALIRAPFDAVVLTKNADIGDIVTPIGAAANAKAAVVTVADMNSLQVEVDVSESNLQRVKIDQPCEIQLDAIPDTRFRGLIHMIVPTADRTKATVLVKVRFIDKDNRILPEMSAKVAFLSRPVKSDEQKPLTAVHKIAVLARNGKNVVFLVKENRAFETPITTGSQLNEMIEVLSGVKAGDRVVMKPLDKIRNGSRIKTAEK